MRIQKGYRPEGFDDEDVYLIELNEEELYYLEVIAGVSALGRDAERLLRQFKDDLYHTLMERHQ